MSGFTVPVLIVSAIGVISGVILAVASKVMAVKVDERFPLLRGAMPGANCGGCGFAGCDDYANKLIEDPNTPTNLCPVGGAAVAQQLSEILGVSFEETAPKYALVHCNGTCENTSYTMDYEGPKTCSACRSFFSGRGSCPSACLGFGDCVKVCNYNAIGVVDGIAVVDPEACIACGMCAKACPQQIIDIVPAASQVYVSCSNHQKGAQTRKACKVGCIACKKCEKVCPNAAITVADNLASIDPEKCTNCGACIGECPTGAIRTVMHCVAK